MPINQMKAFRMSADVQKNLEMKLAIHCATLIKKERFACIVTLWEEECAILSRLLKGTGILYRFLAKKGDTVLVYLYRKNLLCKHLHNHKIHTFLQSYGYSEGNLAHMISELANRMKAFYKGEMGFPHETGAFLGYPLEDVEGFLNDVDGTRCQYVGYWKVYENVEQKKVLFGSYDQLREDAVLAVLEGKSIREIAV
ncbi:MAG: DUF3793 family protein [Eubacteriales bacterium]|nr:DUF3793 family protein [Eubacteriales bacterium]